MSMAIERYQEAESRHPDNLADFANYFIGTLSAKFDFNLDSSEWDDAITKASAFAASRADA